MITRKKKHHMQCKDKKTKNSQFWKSKLNKFHLDLGG